MFLAFGVEFSLVPSQFAFIKHTGSHLLADVISTNTTLPNDSNYVAKANKQSDVTQIQTPLNFSSVFRHILLSTDYNKIIPVKNATDKA